MGSHNSTLQIIPIDHATYLLSEVSIKENNKLTNSYNMEYRRDRLTVVVTYNFLMNYIKSTYLLAQY